MRDLLILAIYIPSILYGFKSPFIALMVYYWISFMNPHRLGWGLTASIPLAMIAALVTIISLIIHYREIKFPAIKEVYIFIIFWFYLTVTTIFSIYPEEAWPYWVTIFKIFLMVLLTMIIVNTPQKLFFLLLGIIFFIGFYGVKGAIFGILTGGEYKIWGPPDTYIADNNDIGLAFVMVAPLCFFLKDLFKKKIYSYSLIIVGVMIIISTILTYSRGALLGVIAMVLFAISKSKYKIRILVATIIVAIIFVPFLPSHWFDRMNTLKTYEEDQSANMRLNSWATSINLAADNFFGGGFLCFSLEQYEKYSPDLSFGNAGQTAHSIYFQVLMEHGFLGLIIFLVMILLILKSQYRLSKVVIANNEELLWITKISRALLVSMMAFFISGAFLSRAYFDLFWAIFAASVCLKSMVMHGTMYIPEEDKHQEILKLPAIKYQR